MINKNRFVIKHLMDIERAYGWLGAWAYDSLKIAPSFSFDKAALELKKPGGMIVFPDDMGKDFDGFDDFKAKVDYFFKNDWKVFINSSCLKKMLLAKYKSPNYLAGEDVRTSYTPRKGKFNANFTSSSYTVSIYGVDYAALRLFAIEFCKAFNQETIMFVNYSYNKLAQIYIADRSIKPAEPEPPKPEPESPKPKPEKLSEIKYFSPDGLTSMPTGSSRQKENFFRGCLENNQKFSCEPFRYFVTEKFEVVEGIDPTQYRSDWKVTGIMVFPSGTNSSDFNPEILANWLKNYLQASGSEELFFGGRITAKDEETDMLYGAFSIGNFFSGSYVDEHGFFFDEGSICIALHKTNLWSIAQELITTFKQKGVLLKYYDHGRDYKNGIYRDNDKYMCRNLALFGEQENN